MLAEDAASGRWYGREPVGQNGGTTENDVWLSFYKMQAEVFKHALRFYADRENYRITGWHGDTDQAKVMEDEGARARKAIIEMEGSYVRGQEVTG